MQPAVSHDVALAKRTTLKLGGTALAEVRVETEEQLELLPGVLRELGGDPLALGCGSNLLARDGVLPLVLVKTEFTTGPVLVSEEDGNSTIRLGAGLRLPKALNWAGREGLTGMEGLSGVPGNVGGAIAMNAGSYGVCMDDVLTRVRVWTPESGVVWLERGQWEAGYRYFQPQVEGSFLLYLGAEVQLKRGRSEEVQAAMKENMAKKKATQPVHLATAGCVFKNPEGQSAGKLLDEAGFRGKRLGGVGFSEMHANFLVHHGGGTSTQALELLAEAEEAIKRKHGISLEREVKVIG